MNYPDGGRAVLYLDGELVLPGTEILPLWTVTKVSVIQPEQLIDGSPVGYEVWVKRLLREDPTDDLLMK